MTDQALERPKCARNGPVKAPVRDITNVDEALARLGELARPGALGCLYRTSFWRLSLLAIASNPEHGTEVMIDEKDIVAEARALEAAHPGLHVCCEHRAKMAGIERQVAAGTYA